MHKTVTLCPAYLMQSVTADVFKLYMSVPLSARTALQNDLHLSSSEVQVHFSELLLTLSYNYNTYSMGRRAMVVKTVFPLRRSSSSFTLTLFVQKAYLPHSFRKTNAFTLGIGNMTCRR
jgi:hypothetical protein